MKRLARFVLRGGRRRAGAAGLVLKRPGVLVFDFDGTIADTFANGFEILNLLSSEFRFRALKQEDLEKARDMRTRELMKFLGIPTTKMRKIARRGTEELTKRIHGIQPLPGMVEILRSAKNEGYRLGIITSNSHENVTTFLKNHDLEIFEFIRSSSKLMGKSHEIALALRELGLAPRDMLFIGDETRDVEAAHEIGVHVAAVTWGYNSRLALENLKPDYLLDSPEELQSLLDSLSKA